MTTSEALLDLVVIGGGPAGHAAALRVSELGGRAAVVEDNQAGGNCVNHCCIPTMTLLDTLDGVQRAQALSIAGVVKADGLPAFNRAVARKNQLIAALSAGIRAQFRTRKIDFLQGRALIDSQRSVRVALMAGGERQLACRNVLVATGARPDLPAIEGLPAADLLWADALLRLPQAPASLLVIGGGPIGLAFALEIAQLFSGFGSAVTLAYAGAAILPEGEPQLVELLAETLRGAGVRLLGEAVVESVRATDAGRVASVRAGGGVVDVPAEVVVAPDSRRPYWGDCGLDRLGIESRDGALSVDEQGQTSIDGLWAAGDVTGGAMFSHTAAQAGRVVGEAVMGLASRRDERWLPRALFTDPEYAWVGQSEAEARAAGHDVRTGTANLMTNARAITMGQREGIVKLIADAASGQLLGAHIVGPGAGELIGQAALAMRLEGTVADLAAVTHWHPTLSEALTEAARRAAG